MALSDLFGISSTAGNSDLQAALQAIQSVQTPTQGQLTLPQLQQYVQAGILTPQQYQAVISNPQIYQQITNATAQTGNNATNAALSQLGGIAQTGSTPINQATLLNNINTTNQAMQGARSGIMEQAQQQGASGGGLEYINQLMNEQNNAQTANTGAVNAASNNAQLALSALSQEGTLGNTEQSTANQMSQAQAQAAQQAAQYNAGLQTAANQYNTQTANEAQAANLANAQSISNQNTGLKNYQTQYNAQVPETMYNNALSKASDEANVYGQQANLAQQQNAMNASLTGNLIGAGATAFAGPYAMAAKGASTAAQNSQPQNQSTNQINNNASSMYNYDKGGEVCYAKGGETHDHTICMKAGGPVPGQDKVPGDSPKNDTVPAKLSPHEIVLPRTVAQAPNAPQAAAQFVNQVKQNGGNPPPRPPMGAPMPPKPMGPPMGQRPAGPPMLAGAQQPKGFGDIIKALESQGLELKIVPKGV
jgi:hypothetical protein